MHISPQKNWALEFPIRVSRFFVEPQMIYGIYGWNSLSRFAVWDSPCKRPPSAGLGLWPWPLDDPFWMAQNLCAGGRSSSSSNYRFAKVTAMFWAFGDCRSQLWSQVLVKPLIDLHQAADRQSSVVIQGISWTRAFGWAKRLAKVWVPFFLNLVSYVSSQRKFWQHIIETWFVAWKSSVKSSGVFALASPSIIGYWTQYLDDH